MFGVNLKKENEEKKLIWILNELDPNFKKNYKKLSKIKPDEKVTTLKYIISSKLKEKHLDLEHEFLLKTKGLGEKHSGVHYIEHRIAKLPSKIKFFETDFERKEFKKICSLLNSISLEIEDV